MLLSRRRTATDQRIALEGILLVMAIGGATDSGEFVKNKCNQQKVKAFQIMLLV